MACNARQKGARCEREAAALFRANGYEARRGQQFSGGEDSPDIIVEGLDHLHFEVKAVQALNVHNALDQAKRDGGPSKIPIVLHKKNNTEWLISLRADDFFNFLYAHTNYKQTETSPVVPKDETSLGGVG